MLTIRDWALAHELFSPRLIRDLSRGVGLEKFFRFTDKLCSTNTTNLTVGSFFDEVFQAVSREGHRNDYVFKSTLVKKKWLGTHSLRTAVALNEFRVGCARADLVLLNGKASAFEVKSDLDSLARLPSQIREYQKVFPLNWVVTNNDHARRVLEDTPTEIGVLILTPRGQLSTLRKATSTLDKIDPLVAISSLRVNEAISLLNLAGINLESSPNTRIWKQIRGKVEHIDQEVFSLLYNDTLKASRNRKDFIPYLGKFPGSIEPMMLMSKFNSKEQAGVESVMKERISDLR